MSALSSGGVTVRGRRLLVDGAPFTVRGVNYSPLESYAKRETSPPDIFYEAHRAVWARDLPRIATLGANVVRVYNWDPGLHDGDLSFLDACAENGLRVVLGISNYFYDNPAALPDIVKQAASHPALLMWAVTNEKVHGVSDAEAAVQYAQIAQLTAAVRSTEDALGTWHPITVPVTCELGHISSLEAAGATLDVHSFQCYWAEREAWPVDFYAQYQQATPKPLLLSEFGLDSYDNAAGGANETTQGSHLGEQWAALISPAATGCATVGGIVFEWMDEPWKGGVRAAANAATGGACDPDRGGLLAGWGPNALPDQCGNEAFFGLTELLDDESLRLKHAYGALQAAWAADPPDACAMPPAPPRPPPSPSPSPAPPAQPSTETMSSTSGAASAASASLVIGLSVAGALVALAKG